MDFYNFRHHLPSMKYTLLIHFFTSNYLRQVYTMNMHSYILVADDDADDRFLIQNAFNEGEVLNPVRYVKDGVELLSYLQQEGTGNQLPGLIILDLNMPRKDGRQVLKEIKNHPYLCMIPVIVLTTSQAENDVCDSYKLGANCYIVKPSDYTRLIDVVKSIRDFWLGFVSLPKNALIV